MHHVELTTFHDPKRADRGAGSSPATLRAVHLAVTVSLVGAESARSSTEDPEASGTITPTMTIAGFEADATAHESGETLLTRVPSSFVDIAGVAHYAFDPHAATTATSRQ
jgi:hypothetical protein